MRRRLSSVKPNLSTACSCHVQSVELHTFCSTVDPNELDTSTVRNFD